MASVKSELYSHKPEVDFLEGGRVTNLKMSGSAEMAPDIFDRSAA
jgi:hypothetical protein